MKTSRPRTPEWSPHRATSAPVDRLADLFEDEFDDQPDWIDDDALRDAGFGTRGGDTAPYWV